MPHISKSQLNELMECPRLYEYTRLLGVPSADSLAGILGTSYHYVWQEFFKFKKSHQKNLSLEWCLDIMRDKFRVEVLEAENLQCEPPEDDLVLDQGIALVKAYLPFAEEIEPLDVEKKYELSIPGLKDWTIQGYIDLIYKSYLMDGSLSVLDDNGQHMWVPVVVDHKTAGSSPYDVQKEERRQAWTAANLWSHEAIGYALAFRVMSGMVEDRFEYHTAVKTKEPKIIISPLKIGDAQINWYLDLAVEQIERRKRGFFERNVNSWRHEPGKCPAWDLCHGIVPEPENRSKLKVV